MSFAFWAIYNCCWNMFIRRTIYWIVIPCAKLQKIFGITIKLGNNFGVWWGLRLFDWGSREGLNLVWWGLRRFELGLKGVQKVWVGFEGCWLTKTICLFYRNIYRPHCYVMPPLIFNFAKRHYTPRAASFHAVFWKRGWNGGMCVMRYVTTQSGH